MLMPESPVKKKKESVGRKPKSNPQINRYMIRLSEKDNEQFLSLYRQSGKRSISAFMTDCVLNNPVKVVTVNKSVWDYVILLSGFFEQFRAIKTNYNQVFHALIRNFGEQKARFMMKIVEESTRKFALSKLEIERLTAQLKERCLPR
ncbi:MAG: hypothetical protein EZS26_003525 [Candidatus Ordinivivax streblomastigis]|uniref:Uncharacterized protein n=1 Tax=Candidatus Ordinivivax streblomastigis TaxID=2540710 RepID=A0A5M8NU09_9BACT|nr:MAG: hypothetical protein EZS26_003525 [Candidatus Ordinivivax streblomastigis]